MAEMDKTFDPYTIEARWYPVWEERGYFAPNLDAPGTPYCIMLPPPNVTGSLHMGHAFQHTLMDALTRYHRMAGDPTHWQPGADHAGIATQMLVERQVEAEGASRHTLGREAFVARIWDWKNQSGGQISRQMRRLGASVDWSRERFTMDAGLSAAVRDVFVDLYAKGLIYRGARLVNWDPVLKTAISDLEVISEEEAGHLWHFQYPLAEGSGHVSVATTRPETMLGDTAVAVHPDDERYTHLIGQTVRLPLANREIPVIADAYVDPEFGSGCVKITPAHDFNDYAMGQRHDLAQINIFNDDASLNDNAPEAYRGLDRYGAREAVIADLDALGLLEATESHRLMVPRGDRSGAVIEPYLTDQWFVDAKTLADPAIAAVEDGRIRFVPGNWAKTYFEWMRNIQDWCISRQLWWGHRIPAWYDAAGNVYVGQSEADVRAAQGLGDDVALIQDEDVLDTWFSSALWPFSTLGWPEATAELALFYPTSVLVTGFDIIFFWVARMIMMGLAFMGDVPFREVYVHGLVRDYDGAKMSKSKGNVLDPIDLIDGIGLEDLVAKRTAGLMQPQKAKAIAATTRRDYPEGIAAFGTDALRFTFAALATPGRDIRFDLGRVAGYRNFCNKLWNAARFVLMALGDDFVPAADADIELSVADRWIVSRLQTAEAEVAAQLEAYRFDLAAKALYDFIWHHFCDWYLELVKPVLSGDASAAAKAGTRRTLARVLEATLRLAHPLMPLITEEIWQRIAPAARGQALAAEGESISLQAFPRANKARIDAGAEAEIDWLRQVINGLRGIRGGMNIAPKQALPVQVCHASARDRQWLTEHRAAIDFLAGVASINEIAAIDAPESATTLVGTMQLRVPLAGLIDQEVELARLDKRLAKLDRDLHSIRGRLANESFITKAPAEVVARTREAAADVEREAAELAEQRARIAAL
jgi:valyl-tRNA synthetase